jgi:hypothetical protein
LEFEKIKRPSSFYFDYFSLTKNFNHIAKAAFILYLKSGGSHKPNYFLTSTPSGHISHLLDPLLLASDGFFIWKKTTDLVELVDFGHG